MSWYLQNHWNQVVQNLKKMLFVIICQLTYKTTMVRSKRFSLREVDVRHVKIAIEIMVKLQGLYGRQGKGLDSIYNWGGGKRKRKLLKLSMFSLRENFFIACSASPHQNKTLAPHKKNLINCFGNTSEHLTVHKIPRKA